MHSRLVVSFHACLASSFQHSQFFLLTIQLVRFRDCFYQSPMKSYQVVEKSRSWMEFFFSMWNELNFLSDLINFLLIFPLFKDFFMGVIRYLCCAELHWIVIFFGIFSRLSIVYSSSKLNWFQLLKIKMWDRAVIKIILVCRYCPTFQFQFH